jgi:hypothetical protein
MADEHISAKRVVYEIPGMERAVCRKDVVYRTTGDGPLTLDLYAPSAADAARDAPLPAVIVVAGYNDVGYEKMLGRKYKEMAGTVSWGQLIAASGLAAIAYTNREPVADLEALLRYVRDHAGELGVDANRIGVWACSGNVPLALWALMKPGRAFLKCGALLYGYTIDVGGATGVADAARMFRFTNPNAGLSPEDLRADLPLMIVRAGQEQFANLNESIDRFFASSLALNRPITLVNHAAGPHSFDVLDDSETSRQIIRQVLDFLSASLA